MFHACAVKMAKMLAHSTPEQAARKERQEAGHRDGEKSQHGHRLQNVQQRQHDLARADALGRDVAVGEGEQQRRGKGDEHPQHRARGVVGDAARRRGTAAAGAVRRSARACRRSGRRRSHSSTKTARMTIASIQPKRQPRSTCCPVVCGYDLVLTFALRCGRCSQTPAMLWRILHGCSRPRRLGSCVSSGELQPRSAGACRVQVLSEAQRARTCQARLLVPPPALGETAAGDVLRVILPRGRRGSSSSADCHSNNCPLRVSAVTRNAGVR